MTTATLKSSQILGDHPYWDVSVHALDNTPKIPVDERVAQAKQNALTLDGGVELEAIPKSSQAIWAPVLKTAATEILSKTIRSFLVLGGTAAVAGVAFLTGNIALKVLTGLGRNLAYIQQTHYLVAGFYEGLFTVVLAVPPVALAVGVFALSLFTTTFFCSTAASAFKDLAHTVSVRWHEIMEIRRNSAPEMRRAWMDEKLEQITEARVRLLTGKEEPHEIIATDLLHPEEKKQAMIAYLNAHSEDITWNRGGCVHALSSLLHGEAAKLALGVSCLGELEARGGAAMEGRDLLSAALRALGPAAPYREAALKGAQK